MPSKFRDPKSLPEWLELDYYRRARFLRRFRRQLNWGFFFLGLLIIGGTMAARSWSFYQAAPVSAAHTMFNNDCGNCHTQKFAPARRFWPGNAAFHTVSNEACENCHKDVPAHQAILQEPECSSCHAEHRGKVELARVDDVDCARCHADLHRIDPNTTKDNVTSFVKHPEFGKELNDPGRLRFNHQVHLQASGVLNAKREMEVLQCNACHQLDSQGLYMLPINYDRHCQSCHSLRLHIVDSSGSMNEAVRNALPGFLSVPLPHPRRSSDEAIAMLRYRLREFVDRFAGLDQGQVSSTPKSHIPGRNSLMRQSDRGTETWLEGQIKANDRFLFASGAGCAYCHVAETENSSLPKSMQAPKYYPTGIRPRWFEKARFSHEKHPETQVTCAECHAAGTSNKSSDVLMPKVQTCQRCHNTGVGARSDCVECHDYHFRTYGDRQATGSWPNN